MTVYKKYEAVTNLLIKKKLTITAMESCTSGTVASLITDTSGSSAVIKGAFITYSNEAKIKAGVDKNIIDTFGVYSEQTAEAMANSAKEYYSADIGIGVTGSLTNLDTENSDSVIGRVYFSVNFTGKTVKRTLDGVTAETRRKAKLAVADSIADCLLTLLKEE